MRAAAFAVGLGLGLLALVPARLLLPAPPLAAAGIGGSLWSARLNGAQAGGLALGDLALAAQPLALLQGRLQWQVAGRLNGRLWRSASAQGVEDLTGRLGGAALPGLAVAGIDLAGLGVVQDAAGRCQSAGGQLSAVLATPLAGQRQLLGSPRCEGEALLLPLASGDGRLRLEIRLVPGRWQARATVAGASAAEQVALAAAGFRADGSALALGREGPW